VSDGDYKSIVNAREARGKLCRVGPAKGSNGCVYWPELGDRRKGRVELASRAGDRTYRQGLDLKVYHIE
jgi:hypothetical protein